MGPAPTRLHPGVRQRGGRAHEEEMVEGTMPDSCRKPRMRARKK